MPTLAIPALVIRRADYSDYDRMVTLFSPEMGRVDAIARGCRRPKSPLVNAVEPFTSGEFQLYHHRDRYSLEQCQISDSYFELRSDYDRLRHGVYWLRLLDAAILPDTPAPELFIVTLWACIAWISCSYAMAIYAMVILGQVYTLTELSQPALTALTVTMGSKVLSNIFEHNNNKIFGTSVGVAGAERENENEL